MPKKIINIVGTRPNFIKIYLLLTEQKKYPELIQPLLVHTGQHYDFEMSQIFFQELEIPKPDYNLEVGSGSHAWQTAKIMERLEPVILKEKPDLVVVVGDVNSTLAGALTAAKLHIPVAHVEAGLRSFDMRMPEEINRRLTDHISDYLFVTEPSGVKNLLNEGIERKKIFLVGNVMIDTLIKSKSKIKNQKSKILKRLKLKNKSYAVLTLHRPENVDNLKVLKQLFEAIGEIQKKIKIVFPVHPRARKQLHNIKTEQYNNILFTEPFGYFDFLALESEAKFVMTDSGGIQEETTFLQTSCLTLRENTERPITIEKGTNILCGRDKEKIIKEVNNILAGGEKKSSKPKYWDGKSAKRIIKIIKKIYQL